MENTLDILLHLVQTNKELYCNKERPITRSGIPMAPLQVYLILPKLMCFPVTPIYRLLGWGNLRLRKGRENPTIHFYSFLSTSTPLIPRGSQTRTFVTQGCKRVVQFCNYLFLSASLHVIIFLRFMRKMSLQQSCCTRTPSKGNTVMVNCLYDRYLTLNSLSFEVNKVSKRKFSLPFCCNKRVSRVSEFRLFLF